MTHVNHDSGIVASRGIDHDGRAGPTSGSRFGKKGSRSRYWPAILITMIVVPMVVVLGFYATIPVKALGPAAVNLGTAGNYVILAETGISTTGATSITGNIAVSPIDSTAITGFSLVMDASGTFSTSAFVTGQVFAADYTAPTPATLTTAIADMQTAYTDAAGRSVDFTNLYAGDLTGQILTPGVYVWSTAVTVAAAGTTISGSASDTWIFQIAQGLTLANGAHVNLTGGASAANIVWQVAGQTTIGTTAVMTGVILCQTAIVMGTGSALEGRALAQTAVTLDATIVTPPGTPIPEFSQVLVPLVGMMFVVAIASMVRNQRK